MQVISLKSLITASNEIQEVEGYIRTFKCHKNDSVESYLHNKAIENEFSSSSRTSLVIDEENDNQIVGYFTILIKAFSFTTASGHNRKKLAGNKKATSFQTILLAKIGRSDTYKGIVEGATILNYALENCKKIDDLSALKIVCVEYDNIPYLKKFYPDNGFTVLQENTSGLTISFLKL